MSEKNEAPEIIFRDTWDFEKCEIHQDAYILKQTHDKEVAELKAEIERLKGRSNRKLSDRFTEILNKFTEEDIQRWIDADAKRLNDIK